MPGKDNDNELGVEAAWIRELAEILKETGLTEIEIQKDNVILRVSRQGGAVAAPLAPIAEAAPAGTVTGAAMISSADHPGAVRSPMVGTAYLAPSSGAEPFAKEGDQVREGQTVMIVEAMKTMNPITAPRAGAVTKILVSDAQPVEFDEPLFIIE